MWLSPQRVRQEITKKGSYPFLRTKREEGVQRALPFGKIRRLQPVEVRRTAIACMAEQNMSFIGSCLQATFEAHVLY